jgi:outer membrane protein OmpA-like peptidoglycan-associated protein
MATDGLDPLMVRLARFGAVTLCALAMVGCGASKSATVDTAGPTPEATVATTGTSASTSEPATTTESTATSSEESTATSLPPGAKPGLDDYNDDGEPDPTCGEQDFGAGIALRIPCAISTANEPENGTTLVENSLYRLPGIDFAEFDNISATAIQARDVDGKKVAIIFFNSDALFAINSADLGGDATTASLNAAILVIKNHYPNAAVQVRGHTDAKGTATSNQKLSEQRAAAVKGYLNAHGLDPAQVSNVGFGSTEPVVAETNPDGSDNPAGRAFNRRVEIVVRAG